MTVGRAARELGISREAVFSLARTGKLKRAGYGKRHHEQNGLRRGHRVTLLTAESVKTEKERRNALKTRHKPAGKKVPAPEAKAPSAPLQGESKGHPVEAAVATTQANQPETPEGKMTVEEAAERYFLLMVSNLFSHDEAEDTPKNVRAACLAAREMCRHYMELCKTLADKSKELGKHFSGISADILELHVDARRLRNTCFWLTLIGAVCAGMAIIKSLC